MTAAAILAQNLRGLSAKISEILKAADARLSEGSFEEFVSTKAGCLAPLIGYYHETLLSVGVPTRLKLNDLIRENYKSVDVQEAAEALLDAEDEWGRFIKRVDAGLAAENLSGRPALSSVAHVGDTGPISVPLVDARTGAEVTLQQYMQRGYRVLHVVLLRHFA